MFSSQQSLALQGIGHTSSAVTSRQPSPAHGSHRVIFSHGASQSTAWLDDATYFQYCAIEKARLLWEGLQKSRMQFSDTLQTQYNEFSTMYSQLAQGMSASEQISHHRWD